MDLKTLTEAIKINNKIKQLKKATDILTNYDAKITCQVGSLHNSNTKNYASVEIPIELIKINEPLKDVLNKEIKNLYKELELL